MIRAVMDKAIIERLTPEQLHFRLIQVKEQLDPHTIKEIQIDNFIEELKSM